MAGLGRAIGGALMGLGDGLMAEGENKRRAALEMLRARNEQDSMRLNDQLARGRAEQSHGFDLAKMDHGAGIDDRQASRDHGFKKEIISTEFGERRGLAAFEGGITRQNQSHKASLDDGNDARSVARREGKDGKGSENSRMSDKDVYERVVTRYTTPETENMDGTKSPAQVNWRAAQDHLRRIGREDLANQITVKTPPKPKRDFSRQRDGSEYSEAQKRLIIEARDAVKKGAPRDAVYDRLEQFGIFMRD